MGHDWGQFLLQTTTTFITCLSPEIFILMMCKVQATPLGFQMPPWHSNSLVISSFEKNHEPSHVSGQWLKLAVYCPKPGMEGVNFTHLYIYHFWPNNSPFRLLTVPYINHQPRDWQQRDITRKVFGQILDQLKVRNPENWRLEPDFSPVFWSILLVH